MVSPVGHNRLHQYHDLPYDTKGIQPILCCHPVGKISPMVFNSGCRVSLYYRCRSSLLRLGTLWQKEHHHQLGLCKDHAHSQLSGTGSMGAESCADSLLRESVLCHHAAEHTCLRHHYGHWCGYRCESGTHQRYLLHLERSHEPALLAPYANQASHTCKRAALYPRNQPCHVHRCGPHHPAVSRLLTHGGCLRTRHYYHHADDYIVARFLPAQQGYGATFHDIVYWHILHHRGHLLNCQFVKVSRRRLVHNAH